MEFWASRPAAARLCVVEAQVLVGRAGEDEGRLEVDGRDSSRVMTFEGTQ